VTNANARDYAGINFRFLPLRAAASSSIPKPGTLSARFDPLLKRTSPPAQVTAKPEDSALFATASVEMWHRGIHSFIISASLTKSSPVWSSVSGYYSSHYCMRALAHALGVFQIYRLKKTVVHGISGKSAHCSFNPKGAGDREHKYYWKYLKQSPLFSANPLFHDNDETGPASDAAHRNFTNYIDHLSAAPTFTPLSKEYLKERIDWISSIRFSAPPIPDRDKFPDIESVQIVAYHRIVAFRRLLDEILGTTNRYWSFHRNPSWTNSLIDFQLIESDPMESAYQQ